MITIKTKFSVKRPKQSRRYIGISICRDCTRKKPAVYEEVHALLFYADNHNNFVTVKKNVGLAILYQHFYFSDCEN